MHLTSLYILRLEVIYIYLLVLVLNKEEYLEKILERFLAVGISGATIIDSAGMGRTLMCSDIPIFGGLSRMFDNCHPSNKTIFSVIRTDETLKDATKAVEEIIDIDDPGVGILFTIPLHSTLGIPKNSKTQNNQGDDL